MQNLSTALQALNVKAIYWVDDENAKAEDINIEKLTADLTSKLVAGGAQAISNVIAKAPLASRKPFGSLQKDFESDQKKPEEDRPDRTKQVETLLNNLIENSKDAKADLGILIECVGGALSSAEKGALVALFAPLAVQVGYQWRPMSFSEWEKEQEKILGEHNASSPALVLLDQQNSRDQSSLDGTQILRAVCTEQTHGAGFKFLVVTNTCTPDGEFAHSAELARALNLEKLGIRCPLFTLSKSRISRSMQDGEQQASLAEHFLSLLRRLRLSVLNQELAELAIQVISKASEKAFARLTSISLHEFMYAVTQSSQVEGVSELDTLLRLLAIEQRDALLSEVVHNGSLRRALERVREFPVSIRKQELSSDTALSQLRAREVYWPKDAVNHLLQPISVGDIFEYQRGRSAKEYFLLLANDCDLMLRSDGTRTAEYVLFAKLREVRGDLNAQLECALPQQTSLKWVGMNEFWAIRTEILDLCWTNIKGVCVWDPRDDLRPLHLLASQKARISALKAHFVKNAPRQKAVASSPFVATESRVIKGRVDFKLRRVNRLSATYAYGILSRFAGVLSRPSYDHDYASVREVDA